MIGGNMKEGVGAGRGLSPSFLSFFSCLERPLLADISHFYMKYISRWSDLPTFNHQKIKWLFAFCRRLPIPRPGEVLGLVGTNGIGKSTALKILAGKQKPNLGRFDVGCRTGCFLKFKPGGTYHLHQTCQLSWFCRESHNFLTFLMASLQHSQSRVFWEISFWNEMLHCRIKTKFCGEC